MNSRTAFGPLTAGLRTVRYTNKHVRMVNDQIEKNEMCVLEVREGRNRRANWVLVGRGERFELNSL